MGGQTVTGAWGYFGKIAAQGDFLRHVLPRDFVGVWDDWLQAGMLESRNALGHRWDDHYLSAPIWRFALAPGIAGASAMVGILMPSIDRVGRHFPLTVAAAAGEAGPWQLLVAAGPILSRLEEAALATLDETGGRDGFEEALAAAPGVPAPSGCGLRRGAGADLIAATPPDAAAAIADGWCTERYGAASLWTTGGEGQGGGPVVLVARGLPPARSFATLLAPPAEGTGPQEIAS